MPWFKVDDQLHSHKKAMRAGTEAMGLWLLAGSWCAGNLTDGFVPSYVVARLAPGGDDLPKRLEQAGLWEAGDCDGDDGWWFNDWSEFNPTSDEVEAKREAARERMRRVRGNRQSRSSDVRANTTRSAPNPDPTRPDPTINPQTLGGTADADTAPPEPDRFAEEFWPTYLDVARGRPTGAGARSKAQRAFRRLSKTDQQKAIDSLPAYGALLTERDAGRSEPFPSKHGSTFLNERFYEDVARELESVRASTRARAGPVDLSGFCGCGQPLDTHDDTTCTEGTT